VNETILPGPRTMRNEACAARKMGVSPGAMRKWRREGSGPPYVRCGKRLIRYFDDILDEWLETRQFASTADELSAETEK
jgi:hypothetical protein